MPHSIADFDFALPDTLVAQQPARPRDHARLLVYDRSNRTITDDYFYNIGSYLPAHSTLVVNDSKVEKCRLRFEAIEIFVTETANPTSITAMVRPGKKFGLQQTVQLSKKDSLCATVTEILPDGQRRLTLSVPLDDPAWDAYRLTPLPPYIAQDESLADEYQTVYARPLGSKAAPTAGLHFTPELLAKIKHGHPYASVTLHVGLGTFAPIKEDIAHHKMHSEWFSITGQDAQRINEANHVVAVGTTTVRTLESARPEHGPLVAQSGDTAIFIQPGYTFKRVDSLITNFHLPKSTLLLLVAAFMGDVSELHRVYQHAIANKYRFYSFGDAMYIV